jgi:hypothetical protein
VVPLFASLPNISRPNVNLPVRCMFSTIQHTSALHICRSLRSQEMWLDRI